MTMASLDYDLSKIPLDENQIYKLTAKVLQKLKAWVRSESIKYGKNMLKIRKTSLVRRRFLTFSKGRDTMKLWIGESPLGVEAFGTPRQTDSGVSVDGKTYDHFINHMNGDEPLVWRRIRGNKRLPIERVTKNMEVADDVMGHILINIQSKFDEILEAELNEILQ